tara:strand:+ start:411 stop:830 length:420 start_codon:yes stop_codon:yes gene_type:complete
MFRKYIPFIIALLSFNVSAQLGNLKKTSNNELVWEKIYDEHLDIESQTINFTGGRFKDPLYIRYLVSAELVVKHKDGKTRLYVKNILTDVFNEIDDISGIAINQRKGTWKKSFLKRDDAKLLNKYLEKSILSLIDESDW